MRPGPDHPAAAPAEAAAFVAAAEASAVAVAVAAASAAGSAVLAWLPAAHPVFVRFGSQLAAPVVVSELVALVGARRC